MYVDPTLELRDILTSTSRSYTAADGTPLETRAKFEWVNNRGHLEKTTESVMASVKALVEAGADLHGPYGAPQHNFGNALHAIAYQAWNPTTKALIDYFYEQGVQLNVLDYNDEMPLDKMHNWPDLYRYVAEKYGVQDQYPDPKTHVRTPLLLSRNYGAIFQERQDDLDLGDGIRARIIPQGYRGLNIWIWDATIDGTQRNHIWDHEDDNGPRGGMIELNFKTDLLTGKSSVTGVAANPIYEMFPRLDMSGRVTEPVGNNLLTMLRAEDFEPVLAMRAGRMAERADYFKKDGYYPVFMEGDNPHDLLERVKTQMHDAMLANREWLGRQTQPADGERATEPFSQLTASMPPLLPAEAATHPGPNSANIAEQTARKKGQRPGPAG